MTIGITERVARLYSNESFKGSAWLISPTHALTARHCLFTGGLLAEGLNLLFPAGGPTVRVRVAKDNPNLDIALLEVVIEDHCAALEERVVQLSRRPLLQPELRVGVAGHPGNSLNNLSAAFRINWQIVDVDQPLPNGGVDKIYAQLGGPSVHNATIEDLKGLSGGPAWCLDDMDGNEPYVAGVMLRVPALDNIFIVPVAALLGWVQVVDDAFAQSPHEVEGPLCLELAVNGLIGWSASVPPLQSAELWESTRRVTSISCRVTRKELGEELFWALVRLVGHTEIPCRLRGVEEWKEATRGLGFDTSARFSECTGSSRRHPVIELAAQFQHLDASAMAEEIHAPLDQWLLNKVDNRVVGILEGATPEVLDYPIDAALSESMLLLWRNSWQPGLARDPQLLRTMLVRMASHDEAAKANGSALARVGKGLGADFRMLWEPYLFALALAVSGIGLSPATLARGNVILTAGGAEGYACGCEKVQGKRITLTLPKVPSWSSVLVLLPLMQGCFLTIFKTSQTMKQGTGRPRIGDPGLPPVIVSSEPSFLIALGQGQDEVRAHVQGIQNELAEIVNARFGTEEAEKWKQRLIF